MKNFRSFIKEDAAGQIENIDDRRLENNLETINNYLDQLTVKPYQNAPIFLTQLRGALERYGIQLPQEATPQFMDLGAELVYALGNSGYHLYIVYDTSDEDNFVDGYAQIVTEDELNDLMDMDLSSVMYHDPIKMRPSTWYAKRDDDSGNTSEYA